jgi:hypothetical protein
MCDYVLDKANHGDYPGSRYLWPPSRYPEHYDECGGVYDDKHGDYPGSRYVSGVPHIDKIR